MVNQIEESFDCIAASHRIGVFFHEGRRNGQWNAEFDDCSRSKFMGVEVIHPARNNLQIGTGVALECT